MLVGQSSGIAMKHTMRPKDRVRAAFAHAEPDRVPIDYLANPSIDARLKAHFGLAGDDCEGLRRALGVDFRTVNAPYVGPKLHADLPGRRIDHWGMRRRWIEHDSGGYWDFCDFPLKDATLQQVLDWPMPSPDDFDYSVVPALCERWRDYYLCTGGPGTGDIINQSGMIRGTEQALVDLITDDEAGLCWTDRKLAVQLEVTRRTLAAAGGAIDLLWIGEDLGTQIAPLIGPALFRRHIRPRHQPFVDLAGSLGIPVMIHSCGSSSWAFEDFLEMGISAVDTLQPEARDMAPAQLKARFGGRLAFHGCISTAGPVARGTVAETVADCRAVLDTMMPAGGYAFAPTHQLQDNSPTENVLAMYATAREYGRYGI